MCSWMPLVLISNCPGFIEPFRRGQQKKLAGDTQESNPAPGPSVSTESSSPEPMNRSPNRLGTVCLESRTDVHPWQWQPPPHTVPWFRGVSRARAACVEPCPGWTHRKRWKGLPQEISVPRAVGEASDQRGTPTCQTDLACISPAPLLGMGKRRGLLGNVQSRHHESRVQLPPARRRGPAPMEMLLPAPARSCRGLAQPPQRIAAPAGMSLPPRPHALLGQGTVQPPPTPAPEPCPAGGTAEPGAAFPVPGKAGFTCCTCSCKAAAGSRQPAPGTSDETCSRCPASKARPPSPTLCLANFSELSQIWGIPSWPPQATALSPEA